MQKAKSNTALLIDDEAMEATNAKTPIVVGNNNCLFVIFFTAINIPFTYTK